MYVTSVQNSIGLLSKLQDLYQVNLADVNTET